MASRGETFRGTPSQIGEVRSLVPKGVTFLALTATATTKLRIQVAQTLGMIDELVVSISPCQQNILYTVGSITTIQVTFLPMLEHLHEMRVKFPRTIVCCRRYEDCANLYIYFKKGLQASFTEPPGAPDLPRFHFVDMYLSCTEQVVKEEIIKSFTQESNLRIVVATVAFGMGIDCAGIRQVIHFGPTSDLESYV